MGWKEHFSIGSFIFVVFCFIFLVWGHFNMRQSTSVNAETYTTLIHKCVKNCIEASKMTDSVYALIKITEARSCIETLSKFCGGDLILGNISGTNIIKILNTLNYQEQIIRSYLPKEQHPLISEITL